MSATNMSAILLIRDRIEFAKKQMHQCSLDERAAYDRRMTWCRKIDQLEEELAKAQQNILHGADGHAPFQK